ncbi:hypothetical protein RIR_jg27055.t1 [Rhizophagus irregularis DAOM 181602=DAOM 197198]|nr:hypothetical protein RhiirB3_179551 [Rhizophagus irregularis]GET58056.1 hypothetical protein RIR_jg27055.t1 [Rhizophagus irregularis DAOM 181602=DAOM 197198]
MDQPCHLSFFLWYRFTIIRMCEYNQILCDKIIVWEQFKFSQYHTKFFLVNSFNSFKSFTRDAAITAYKE